MPSHWEQVTGPEPGLAPEPEHVSHVTGSRSRTSWDTPNTASPKSSWMAVSTSLPRGGPAWRRPPAPKGEPPPKNDWKMSPRLAPKMSSKPAPPGAPVPRRPSGPKVS